MTDDETLAAVQQLMEWARANDEVRRALAGLAQRHGYSGMGDLADKDPGLFDVIYEGLKDVMEQVPWT